MLLLIYKQQVNQMDNMQAMLEDLKASQANLTESLEILQEATDDLTEIEQRYPVLKWFNFLVS